MIAFLEYISWYVIATVCVLAVVMIYYGEISDSWETAKWSSGPYRFSDFLRAFAKATATLLRIVSVALPIVVFFYLINHSVSAAWEEGTLPFYIAGGVGLVLLYISVVKKNAVIGTLGAGLVAAAFSHWVGPIAFPK